MSTSATPAAPPRRSKTIAKIWAERCTGCEACIAVAPWDNCIVKANQLEATSSETPTGMIVCDVQPAVCTGCTLCMKICPWDAITMVPRPTEEPPKPVPSEAKF